MSSSAASAKSETSISSLSEKKIYQTKPKFWDVYFLAMTIGLGGQFYRWNDPLHTGFWPQIIAVCYSAIGYMCFALCMSEMSSTLPFSGGIYGFVRAFVGPYFGYVVSRFEIMLNISYVATLAILMGSFLTHTGFASREEMVGWWCLLYGSTVGLALIGCNYKAYWGFIKLLGGAILILLVIYIFGSMQYVNFDTYAGGNAPIDIEETIRDLYQTAGMFRGLHYLPLVSIKLDEPKKILPAGMMWGMLTLCVTAIGMVFTACSQSPGTQGLVENLLPLTYGFSNIFHISFDQAAWLTFPAWFGNFYGFVWAYGRQLSSMAKSGLLPEMFSYMTKTTDTPYVSLIAGTVASFILTIICYYDLFYIDFKSDIKYLYMLSSYIVYILMFVSYIIFKGKYSSLPRSFASPLGIVGALIGIAVFFIDAICIVVFTCGVNQAPLLIMIGIALASTIYYFLILHGNQQFSEEEKEKLFKAYLINANAKSRQLAKKKAKVGFISPHASVNGDKKSQISPGKSKNPREFSEHSMAKSTLANPIDDSYRLSSYDRSSNRTLETQSTHQTKGSGIIRSNQITPEDMIPYQNDNDNKNDDDHDTEENGYLKEDAIMNAIGTDDIENQSDDIPHSIDGYHQNKDDISILEKVSEKVFGWMMSSKKEAEGNNAHGGGNSSKKRLLGSFFQHHNLVTPEILAVVRTNEIPSIAPSTTAVPTQHAISTVQHDELLVGNKDEETEENV